MLKSLNDVSNEVCSNFYENILDIQNAEKKVSQELVWILFFHFIFTYVMYCSKIWIRSLLIFCEIFLIHKGMKFKRMIWLSFSSYYLNIFLPDDKKKIIYMVELCVCYRKNNGKNRVILFFFFALKL